MELGIRVRDVVFLFVWSIFMFLVSIIDPALSTNGKCLMAFTGGIGVGVALFSMLLAIKSQEETYDDDMPGRDDDDDDAKF